MTNPLRRRGRALRLPGVPSSRRGTQPRAHVLRSLSSRVVEETPGTSELPLRTIETYLGAVRLNLSCPPVNTAPCPIGRCRRLRHSSTFKSVFRIWLGCMDGNSMKEQQGIEQGACLKAPREQNALVTYLAPSTGSLPKRAIRTCVHHGPPTLPAYSKSRGLQICGTCRT